MSEDWLGCRVSLDCGSLGFFQGVISRIRLSDQVIPASHWSIFSILSSDWSIFLILSSHWSILSDTSIFSIHGKMKKKRHKIFNQFREAKSGILLCTDVMARGVDIPDVDWCVQSSLIMMQQASTLKLSKGRVRIFSF